MDTKYLTKADFDANGQYLSASLEFVGHIRIAASLGWVRFTRISAQGAIVAEAGTGIEAGWGIEAGEGIKAGTGIEAGEGIEAGRGIEAGGGIKAGTGIEAGWGITCRLALVAKLSIFAGICTWRRTTEADRKIVCAQLEGSVAYGSVELIAPVTAEVVSAAEVAQSDEA